MQAVHERSSDPLLPTLALCAAFLALCLWRISTPYSVYFDEVHYLPAARALLDGSQWLNAEHPPLGKYIFAGGVWMFGNTPFGWRVLPAIAGAIALFALTRALWEASRLRYATLAYCWLLATGFFLIVHARIAMLDMFMVAFFAIALWQCARAVRAPEEGRMRLVFAGIALGAAMATKWNAVPLAVVPGLAFFGARLIAGRRRLLTSQRGAPVPGISLLEAALWLGALPVLVYWASFIPVQWYIAQPYGDLGFIDIQKHMLELQQSVINPHPYQSTWWQWMSNTRGIWYLYEEIDGAQRGVLLIGNPLTMLIGLPAVLWCGWAAYKHDRKDALAVAVLYAASIGFWIVAAKPIQFYYHYFLPSCFLLAALALALDAIRQHGRAWISHATLAASAGVFVFFFPILTGMALEGPDSFWTWTWLDGWR